jgi:hypothetical protein
VSISSSNTKKWPLPSRMRSTLTSISITSRPSRSIAVTARRSAVPLKQIIPIAARRPGPVSAPVTRSECVATTVHPFRRATSRSSASCRGLLASCDRAFVDTLASSTARRDRRRFVTGRSYLNTGAVVATLRRDRYGVRRQTIGHPRAVGGSHGVCTDNHIAQMGEKRKAFTAPLASLSGLAPRDSRSRIAKPPT